MLETRVICMAPYAYINITFSGDIIRIIAECELYHDVHNYVARANCGWVEIRKHLMATRFLDYFM